MKKLFLTLGIAVLTASVLSAKGLPKNNFHNSEIGTYERVTKYGPYLTGKFFDNTFLGLAGGVNLYNYQYDGSSKPGLGDRLGVSVDAYFGKWVTPSWGLRVGYSGMTSKNLLTPAVDLEVGDTDLLYEADFMFLHADLMFNLSNALGGYKENRFWDLVPFVGAGYAHNKWVEGVDEVNQHKIAATAGLLNNFQLGHRVDLTLEGRFMFVDRNFDGQYLKSKWDNTLAVTAGLTFKFGAKHGFKRPVYNAPVDLTPYESRIKSLEGDVARDRETIARLTRELEAAKNAPKTVEKVTEPVAVTTHFELDKAVVLQQEMANLEAIAKIIKENPSRKFNVTGYADAGTGSKEHNLKLSEKRANNVADVLVKNFGVNRSQLVVSGKGGVSKHPNIPVLDRVVVTE